MNEMTDHEYRKSIRAAKLTQLNLKQFTKGQIQILNLTKRELAEKAGLYQEDLTFDSALPQQWLRAFTVLTKLDYHFVLGTTFTLYSTKHNIHGLIWSACKEIDDLVDNV